MFLSDEANGDPREVGSESDPGPELVRAALMCLHWRRSSRRAHLAICQLQNIGSGARPGKYIRWILPKLLVVAKPKLQCDNEG